jgi:hypothetical protein
VTAICRVTRLALILAIGCTLAACGGGDGAAAGTPASHSTTSGSGPGGSTSVPPLILQFDVMGAEGKPEALLVQGQGYATVSMDAAAQPGTAGVNLVSMQTTTVDSNGKQVAPITAFSLTGYTSTYSSGTIVFNPTVQVPIANSGVFTLEGWVTDSSGNRSDTATNTIHVVASSIYATVVSATGPDPAPLIQSNGTLYWAESGEDALKSAPTTGGAARVLATRMLNPTSVVFSGSNVIWLDDRDGTVANCTASSVTRVLKQTATSGYTSVLASGPSCSGGASQIVLVGTTVYWVSSTASPATWVINALSLSGAAATTVRTTTRPIVALAANAGTLYWMENPYPNGAATIFALTPGGALSTVASGFIADAGTFAVDSTAVYYATPNVPATTPPTETLWAQPLAGGSAQTLAASISTPVKLLSTLPLGGSSVLWMDQAAVNSIPATGGTVTPLASVSGTPLDLLYDGTNVRWTEITANIGQYGETGMIESVPLGGGAVTTVYQGGDAPRELAQDLQGRLNWTEGGPVGVTEGFARIARIGATGSAEAVATGINAAYLVSSYLIALNALSGQYPFSLPLVATSTSLLIGDRWRIKSLPLTGGQLTTVAAPDGGVIAGLATDGTSVYWDDSSSSVSEAPAGGGAITALVPPSVVSGYAGPGGPIVLAPDGTLDWVINDSCSPSTCAVSIASAPSSAPSNSLNIINSANILKGGSLYVPGLAVTSTALYIAEPEWPSIGVIGQGSFFQWFPYIDSPTVMATDGSALYWTAEEGTVISKGTINAGPGGTMGPLIVESQKGNPLTLALDANYVYFVDAQLIRKTPK